jgi:hypothetical protein
MRALFACVALILIDGCGTRGGSPSTYVCDRPVTQRSLPVECMPQGMPGHPERATALPDEFRSVDPNGAVTVQTTVIRPPESVVVIPALPTQ